MLNAYSGRSTLPQLGRSQACHLNFKKQIFIANRHKRLKNPNWMEADQSAICNRDRGVKLESTKEATPA